VRTWSSIVKRRNATSVVPFAWYDHEKSQWLSTLPLWRHWKFIPRISPISARDNGLLTPPHKQTHIHAVQRRHNTATYQYREGSTLWADSVRALKPRVSPPREHVIWSPSVCYCLERWFLTRPVHRDAWIYVQSRRLDGRNPDNFKGTWLISDLMTASYPQFHRFFSHVKRLLRRRNTSTGHSLEFPSTRVNEWDRGFYTSREMTVHVCFSFRLPGISILTFRRPTNTK
jgi:hypothetical protein